MGKPLLAFTASLLCVALASCASQEGKGSAPQQASPAIDKERRQELQEAIAPQALQRVLPAKNAPQAAPHFDPLSGIMFPTSLGGMALESAKEFPEASRGTLLRYSKSAGESYPRLDVFVSPVEGQDLPDGIASPELKRAFNAALTEIAEQAKEGVYKNLKFSYRRPLALKRADAAGELEALVAKCSFSLGEKSACDSYLLVTAYKGAILKLRFTTPSSPNADEAFEEIKNALPGLLYKSGKTNVDAETKAAVFSAVDALESDPLGMGVLATPAILGFAKDSPDVIVSLAPASLPWIQARENLKHQELLLAAYVGGNVRKQLLDAKVKDSPVDGLRCLFKTYKKIRGAEPEFRSPSIETLIKLDEEGKLDDALPFKRGSDEKAPRK